MNNLIQKLATNEPSQTWMSLLQGLMNHPCCFGFATTTQTLMHARHASTALPMHQAIRTKGSPTLMKLRFALECDLRSACSLSDKRFVRAARAGVPHGTPLAPRE